MAPYSVVLESVRLLAQILNSPKKWEGVHKALNLAKFCQFEVVFVSGNWPGFFSRESPFKSRSKLSLPVFILKFDINNSFFWRGAQFFRYWNFPRYIRILGAARKYEKYLLRNSHQNLSHSSYQCQICYVIFSKIYSHKKTDQKIVNLSCSITKIW